jgi:hypothetical protein
MRYIALGTVSSEQEFQEVVVQASGEQVYELTELLTTLDAAERTGFKSEQKRWAAAPSATSIKIYSGDPKPPASSIWAAIEVCADGTLKLLKIVNTFGGGNQEANDLLADAIHRRNRSIGP